jgi:glutaredoxin-like YruB-family protein
MKWIKNKQELEEVQQKYKEMFVLFFYGDFSSSAKRALKEIEAFSENYKEVPIFGIDVVSLKGVNKQWDVDTVPTVLAFENGKVKQRITGVQNERFYARLFSGVKTFKFKPTKKRTLSVTVYSGSGCPACSTAKNYLRKRGVHFREIDVSTDQQAAQRLVERSGQMAVPQIEINGQIVVGFDKTKLESLL